MDIFIPLSIIVLFGLATVLIALNFRKKKGNPKPVAPTPKPICPICKNDLRIVDGWVKCDWCEKATERIRQRSAERDSTTQTHKRTVNPPTRPTSGNKQTSRGTSSISSSDDGFLLGIATGEGIGSSSSDSSSSSSDSSNSNSGFSGHGGGDFGGGGASSDW